MIDIVLPLGNGSQSDNDELRILLRSIDAHAKNVRRIIVVSDCAPKWLARKVRVVPCPDDYSIGKDARMTNKILCALKIMGVMGDFVLLADDNVFMQDMDIEKIPVVYVPHGMDMFKGSTRSWCRRMYRTLEFLKSKGFRTDRHYEAHIPQVFNAEKILNGISSIDYKFGVGFGIYTLFRYLCGIPARPEMLENWKNTFNGNDIAHNFDRPFIGYNDKGFIEGHLRERLFNVFPEPSQYEDYRE